MRHVVFFAALLATLLITAFALDAHAEEWKPDLAQQCAASFPERHADAISAINQQAAYTAERDRVMPWFDANCRPLTELERAIRKIDDPAAFVCRTSKGRPKELTSDFLLQHASPVDVVHFQDRYHDNDECEPYDRAARVSLVLREPTAAQKLAVYCFQSTSPKCAPVHEALAAAAPGKAAAR